MPSRSSEEKQQINAIRDKLNEVEAALRPCLWMSQADKERVLAGMSWVRDHINRGRTEPSISMLYNQLFFKHAMDNLSIDRMIVELQQNQPTYPTYNRELASQLEMITGGCFQNYTGQGKERSPFNFTLSAKHPDKTDQFGVPYYLPTDADGVPIAGLTVDDLSYTQGATVARANHGVLGVHTDEMGYRVQRFKLPEITEHGREQHRQQLERAKMAKGQEEAQEYYMKQLAKWYKDVYMKSQLDSWRDSLEKQQEHLREALKRDEILKEDAQLDIDAEMRRKEERLKLPLQDTTQLFRFETRYKQYLEQKDTKK